jgi:prepilin-type N-terminal cleavage/methylation domain-containing protein
LHHRWSGKNIILGVQFRPGEALYIEGVFYRGGYAKGTKAVVAEWKGLWERRGSGSRGGRAGFTLMELLVVIAIIALLMAILMPALQRVRKQGKDVMCRANLKQWGITLALYTEDNQGRFATDLSGYGGIWLFRGAFLSGDDPNAPQDSLHRFHTQDIMCCPLATRPAQNGVFSASFGTTKMKGSPGGKFTAWEITSPAPAFQGSYGFNTYLFSGFSERPNVGLGRDRFAPLDVFSLRGRAEIPVLLDAAHLWGTPRESDWPPQQESFVGGLSMGSFCVNRHNGHINGLLLDWSIRRVGLKELWTLRWSRDFDRAGRWTKADGVQPEDWPEWMRRLPDY